MAEGACCLRPQFKRSRLLPMLEKIFSRGRGASRNDVDLTAEFAVEDSNRYWPILISTRPRRCEAMCHRKPISDDA